MAMGYRFLSPLDLLAAGFGYVVLVSGFLGFEMKVSGGTRKCGIDS